MISSTLTHHGLVRWIKAQESPLARRLYRCAKSLRVFEIPMISAFHRPLYLVHRIAAKFLHEILRVLYWTPLFRSRLNGATRRLYLFGGMPLVIGPVNLTIGDDCRVSGHVTISGRGASATAPELRVGRNCDIGWQTTIAVGRHITLGNNVRIAGRAFLAGYPGHPLDPRERAIGLPDKENQVGDIVLEDDVWLATGVFVMAGVRIGQGTVVAAGSVVTHDLPPGVLAGGVPARVIKPLPVQEKTIYAS